LYGSSGEFDALGTRASGHAERLAALHLIAPRTGPKPATLGADKDFDTRDFVMELRKLSVTRMWRNMRATGARIAAAWRCWMADRSLTP
jgi:hypothetical protein